MSNVNIYEKNWLDLVFEGKNKAYGAYQLRQQESRTTFTALLFGLLFVASVSGLGLLLSSFGEKPHITPTEDYIIEVSNYNPPMNEPEKAMPAAAEAKADDTKEKVLDNPTVVSEAPDDIMTNEEARKTPNPSENPEGEGTGTAVNTGGTELGEGKTTGIITTPKPEGTVTTAMLDKLPQYPGGIEKFYRYVGNNFKNPELDVDQVTVIMSFVIEKDGKMTDIKVLRSPGYGLDREAIRVLKSLKTKWEPGIKDGQAVRTLYTLPITVKI